MRPIGVATIALGFLLTAPSMASAQYVQVVTVTVRSSTGPEFADYLSRAKEAAQRLGDPRQVSVWRPVLGGAPNRFIIVTTFDDYAELDTWRGNGVALVTEAFGEDEGEEFRELNQDIIVSVDIAVEQLRPDLSGSADTSPVESGYLTIVTTEVEPSGAPDYVAALTAAAVVEKERGIRRNRWARVRGGSFVYVATNVFESFAEQGLPGPPTLLAEAYGEAGQRMWERANSVVRWRTFETWRYDPELSRRPM